MVNLTSIDWNSLKVDNTGLVIILIFVAVLIIAFMVWILLKIKRKKQSKENESIHSDIIKVRKAIREADKTLAILDDYYKKFEQLTKGLR